MFDGVLDLAWKFKNTLWLGFFHAAIYYWVFLVDHYFGGEVKYFLRLEDNLFLLLKGITI